MPLPGASTWSPETASLSPARHPTAATTFTVEVDGTVPSGTLIATSVTMLARKHFGSVRSSQPVCSVMRVKLRPPSVERYRPLPVAA